ncbi:hypothetical protein JMUB5695_01864 [Mycobacterium heckeshornense]|uniref:amino acid aminotransferase n=1 Tax=Mycobacterium heckeshornense TaxID=110505 RepID=UPI0019414B2A|nr:amino acid aminotransferase [Mycobacterium heckeshornense]BCQ08432.1 hypothetical protein JMUB5695_01864 [Mycobacterium heckeshornense]
MPTHTDPADVERAALDLLIEVPLMMAKEPDTGPLAAVMRELAAILAAEGVFTGLSWFDARHAATAIAFDAVARDDGPGFLRGRAERAETGGDGMSWDDPAGMARAFRIAAEVLDR